MEKKEKGTRISDEWKSLPQSEGLGVMYVGFSVTDVGSFNA